MRQFVVPQFIEVENKILGPITVRQFALMLGALFISIAFYKFTDFTLFILVTVLDFGIAGVFGFVKVNGRPIHFFFMNLLKNSLTPNRRLWCKDFSNHEIENRIKIKKDKDGDGAAFVPKTIKKSRLSELSLIVDTGGKYQGN